MKIRVPFGFVLMLAVLILAACPSAGTGGAPKPGDADYVPAGWAAPALEYSKNEYLPSAVVEYEQAPGVHARNSTFRISGNESNILGFPDGGGTYAPDNGSLVSLGMAGGYVVLEFDPPLENYTGAADFIVYGNAYYKSGDAELVWQEPGTVWVMADSNGNGLPDDAWYLLAPAYKNAASDEWTALVSSSSSLSSINYEKSDYDASWWPEAADGETSLTFDGVFVLPDSLYAASGTTPIVRGLADTAPTLVLGDLDGDDATDGAADYPGIDPVYFYTRPDAPGDRSIDAVTGGGAAMDIDWAVDPSASFGAAALFSAKWVKIVSGTTLLNGAVGDYSCEVDAVVRAAAP